MPDYNTELTLLYRALASPYGIAISVDNHKLAKAHLYAARAASGDDSLTVLQIRTSPDSPDTEIWIIKGQTEVISNAP